MRPLLVLLERLWGPLGASLTALGGLLEGSWELFGGSWDAPEHDFENMSEQGTGSACG